MAFEEDPTTIAVLNGGLPQQRQKPEGIDIGDETDGDRTAEVTTTFDAELARALGIRATRAQQNGETAAAVDRDIQDGVGAMYEHVDRRRTAAHRNANGIGTPVAELPLDATTQAYVTRFLELMNGSEDADPRPRDTWTFYEVVEVPPAPVAPAPAPAPVVTGQTGRSFRKVAAKQPVAPAPAPTPPTPPTPTYRRVITKEVSGWEVGYVERGNRVTTSGNLELWTELESETDLVVLGHDGAFYCIPTEVTATGVTPILRDTRPRSLPLDANALPEGPEQGTFTGARTTTIYPNGQPLNVRYAEFRPSRASLRDRLLDIAVRTSPSATSSAAAQTA